MEIAHAPTGMLRVIAKLVLLGLLVILLAKVILALLALAIVGAVAYVCARALYARKAFIKRSILRTGRMLIWSVAALFQAGIALLLATAVCFSVCGSLILWKSIPFACTRVKKLARLGSCVAQTIIASALVPCGFLRRAGKIGCAIIGKSAGSLAQVSGQGCGSISRLAGAACVTISNQTSLICGTLIEAASGALVGAMLGFVSSEQGLLLLPHTNAILARVCAAALFGAFLGIALGLSRTCGATANELGHFLDNPGPGTLPTFEKNP